MTIQVMSERHGFVECPRWHDGFLYVSDMFAGKIFTFDENGNKSLVCDVPGRPAGMGWTPEGDLLIVSIDDRKLWRLEGDNLLEIADLSQLAPWHTNDMVVDESGGCYIGNFGWDEQTQDEIQPTVLIRVDADGTVSKAADDLVFPNGMVITPDGGTLLVSETFAGRIAAFDRAQDGSLSNRRTWADFSGGKTFTTLTEALASKACLPDGLALANDGTLWVADAGGQGALHVAEGGEIIETVPLGEQTAFAVALGGKDLNRLFLCAAVPYGTGDPWNNWESRLLWTEVENG
jgi:sugar lactone lactonase YvrE